MAIYRLLLFRWAPLIYLATALPTAIFLAYLAPPLQVPDENQHLLRAIEVLGGHFAGSPGSTGGIVPRNAARVAEAFHAMEAHADVKIDPALISAMRALPWAADDAAPAPYPATAGAPPFFYEPAVIGLGIARTLGLGIYDGYLVGRIVDAVVAVGIGTLAIGMAIAGRALLFVLLSLPMTLYLGAAVAPDALTIASAALAVGLCSRAAGSGRPLGAARRLLMGLLIGAAVATRPAYWPLLALLLTAAARPRRQRPFPAGFLAALAPFCLAIAIVVGWSWLAGASIRLPNAIPSPAAIKAEVDLIRQALPGMAEAMRHAVVDDGVATLRGMVGVFGWSDTPIPATVFVAWLLALGLAVGLAFVEEGEALPFGVGLALLVCGALAAGTVAAGVPASQISATAAALVGRELLPLATLLALAVPALAVARARIAYSGFGNVLAVAGWTGIFVLAAISDWLVLPPVLLNRFYL